MITMTTGQLAATIHNDDLRNTAYREAADELLVALDERERALYRRQNQLEAAILKTMMQHWQTYYDRQQQQQEPKLSQPASTETAVYPKTGTPVRHEAVLLIPIMEQQ